MRTIICPKPFEWEVDPHPATARAEAATKRTETFPAFVRNLIERTADFGKWPMVLRALAILKALDGKNEGDEIRIDDDDLKLLAKAMRGQAWLPVFAFELAKAGFFQAIEDAAKPDGK